MCENSPFPGGFVLLCRSRCLASELRLPKALLLRIESTHALNSFVRSCVDDMGDVYTIMEKVNVAHVIRRRASIVLSDLEKIRAT